MKYADCSDHLMASRALSEERIEDIRALGGVFVEAVRATRVPMLVADPGLPGNPVVFANGAFLALSGYAMEQVIGQGPHFMDGPQTSPASIGRFKTAIAAGRDETLDLLQYHSDGSTFWASVFVSPLRDEGGRIIHHFLSFLDITTRVEAEADLRTLTATLERRLFERTTELEAANASLTELLTERKMLLREVDHRAKNSLMIASSLLSVQAAQQADPTVQTVLEQAQSRLRAMAKAHDLLSLSDDSRQVALADYLRAVCLSLTPPDAGSAIRIVVDAEDHISVSADQAVPVGLIVNELTTNALKHAFPPSTGGTIEVRVRRCAQDRVVLTVSDDGVGIPGGRNGNLGFGIVRALARQIGAEIDMGGDRGVTVTISFSVA
jgi:PAS domain S-box-containing protein